MAWTLLLRSGALGDFILTLPLLQAVDRPICVITRSSYLPLLPQERRQDRFIDSSSAVMSELYAGRIHPELVALLPDSRCLIFHRPDAMIEACLRNAGAAVVTFLEPRPTSPPHAAEQFLREAGFSIPANLTGTPFLKQDLAGDALWLHPGSGSPRKNAPVRLFRTLAEQWPGRCIVSFGEADEQVADEVRSAFMDIDYTEISQRSLAEVRDLMQQQARCMIGNDSGISHLAAALGIPTAAIFRSTDPAIWRPCGMVEVFRDTQDAELLEWLRRQGGEG